jgi:ABC-type branched-subunit amino acid transport system substrate-binding protein
MSKFLGKLCSVFSLGILVSMLLVACGDNTATPSTSAPATTAAASATTVAASATTAAASATTVAASATTAAAASATTAATSTTAAAASATTAAVSATTAASATAGTVAQGTIPANLKAGPGVDTAAKTIKVAMMVPLTGAQAPQGVKLPVGQEAYFKWLNDNGGINGYKVVLVPQDTKYNAQTGVQVYNKVSGDVAMISTIMGTNVLTAIKDQTISDKMLVMYSGSSSSLIPLANVVTTAPPYLIDAVNAFDYVVNGLGKKNPKTAIVYQDDPLGADALHGYKEAVKAFGLQDVAQIPYKATDTDATGQATALKNSGAEFVYLAGVVAPIGKIVNTSESLGFKAKYILQNTGWDVTLLNTAARDALTGAIVLGQYASWTETNQEGIATMVSALKKYAPSEVESNYTTAGWIQAMVTHIILKKALENGDITRDGLLATSQALKNVNLGGIAPTLSRGNTTNERVSIRVSRIMEVDPSTPSGLKVIKPEFGGDFAKNFVFK